MIGWEFRIVLVQIRVEGLDSSRKISLSRVPDPLCKLLCEIYGYWICESSCRSCFCFCFYFWLNASSDLKLLCFLEMRLTCIFVHYSFFIMFSVVDQTLTIFFPSIFQHHSKNKKCHVCLKPTGGIFNAAQEIRKKMAQDKKQQE